MRRQHKPGLWPPFQSIETLAAALDMTVEYVQQLVKRGILPGPIMIAETERFDFALVTQRLTRSPQSGIQMGLAQKNNCVPRIAGQVTSIHRPRQIRPTSLATPSSPTGNGRAGDKLAEPDR